MTYRAWLSLFLGASTLLTLTACGEGQWEPKKYTGFPYTEERTAGSGIEYVRAHMLPEKGPILLDATPILEKKLGTKK